MNELQKRELELLEVLLQICEAMGLEYFLVCGSALGAVKYGGFIQWDDDLDVGLFREDYERFIKKAPDFLPEYLFLQTYQTDKAYPNIFAKLRDSRTTYIEKSVADISMHHGVYIDIFPLDGYPKHIQEQNRLERKKRLYKMCVSCVFSVDRKMKGRVAVAIMRRLGIHKKTCIILDRYEQAISRYTIKESEVICNHGNWQGKLEYAPKWHYGEGTWATFEGLRVRIPEHYDAYLTQKYGNWRADLPEEKRIGHHYFEVCDINHPYTDYIEKLQNGKIRVKQPNGK